MDFPFLNSCQAKNKLSKLIINSKTLWRTLLIKPPPDRVDVPLVHKLCEFYKSFYVLSGKIPKRDKFGIYSKIESIILEIINLAISATFEIKPNKISLLKLLRIKIGVTKKLVRIMNELSIIERKKYIELELGLQEISKMTNGWLKYLQENPA